MQCKCDVSLAKPKTNVISFYFTILTCVLN